MASVASDVRIHQLIWHGKQDPEQMCRVVHFVHEKDEILSLFNEEGLTLGSLKIERWTPELFSAFKCAQIESVASITLSGCSMEASELAFLTAIWKVKRIVLKQGGKILKQGVAIKLPPIITGSKGRIPSGEYAFDKVVVSPEVNPKVTVVVGEWKVFRQLVDGVTSLKVQEVDLSGGNGQLLSSILREHLHVTALDLKNCPGRDDFAATLTASWPERRVGRWVVSP